MSRSPGEPSVGGACSGTPAEPPAAARRLLAERPRGGEYVGDRDLHELVDGQRPELAVRAFLEAQRLGVQRELEDRPRIAGVAERLTAAGSVEYVGERPLGALVEPVLAGGGEEAGDREQLAGRVVGKDDLPLEPRAKASR